MKVSRYWLQKFFNDALPEAQALEDALTFHAFEVESIEAHGSDAILDVKVTPNRGHDCLSCRGIAKELSAILDTPFAHDPFAQKPDLSKKTNAVSVAIEDPDLCKRYIAAYIKGVKVGPSPKWLKERLESIGQKPINNIVDATNFVMFNTGQPLHAFDAKNLKQLDGEYKIAVRLEKGTGSMTALDGKEYKLSGSNLLIVDANANSAIGIAGVKGGLAAAITEETTDIIIESANFDGASVRKTAQALKLRTDASMRFEQVISPELAAHGMQNVVDLILKIAEGELAGFVDQYSQPQTKKEVSVRLEKINGLFGIELGTQEVENVFKRLGFSYTKDGGIFVVEAPFERLDLEIPEDLVEEVGRIIGYDKIPAAQLPHLSRKPEVNRNFYAAEEAREEWLSKGYSEVYTSVFAEKGERVIANKIDGVRPYLRTNLVDGLREAYEKNKRNAEFLGLKEVKLFEIGTVWEGGEEKQMIGIADKSGMREMEIKMPKEIPDSYSDLPLSKATRYQPFSKYPFIIRDVAFWAAKDTNSMEVEQMLRALAGALAVKMFLFDRFEKGNRVSLAYRLIFQSSERTLTEEEINPIMEKIYFTLKEKQFEIR